MSEHEIVTAAQAEIQALTELARDLAADRDRLSELAGDLSDDRDRWRKRAEHAEALLAHSRTSLAERFNAPMDGGAP